MKLSPEVGDCIVPADAEATKDAAVKVEMRPSIVSDGWEMLLYGKSVQYGVETSRNRTKGHAALFARY